MSIVPSTFAAGFAGAIAARPAAAENERTLESARGVEKEQAANEESERASGMGEADEEQATQDRDGDGRQVWEIGGHGKKEKPQGEPNDPEQHLAKDPTGDCGNLLDLQG
jgi:hypothetical protein